MPQVWVWMTVVAYFVWRTKWRVERRRAEREEEEEAGADARSQREWGE